jgi:hypothetical protein
MQIMIAASGDDLLSATAACSNSGHGDRRYFLSGAKRSKDAAFNP